MDTFRNINQMGSDGVNETIRAANEKLNAITNIHTRADQIVKAASKMKLFAGAQGLGGKISKVLQKTNPDLAGKAETFVNKQVENVTDKAKEAGSFIKDKLSGAVDKTVEQGGEAGDFEAAGKGVESGAMRFAEKPQLDRENPFNSEPTLNVEKPLDTTGETNVGEAGSEVENTAVRGVEKTALKPITEEATDETAEELSTNIAQRAGALSSRLGALQEQISSGVAERAPAAFTAPTGNSVALRPPPPEATPEAGAGAGGSSEAESNLARDAAGAAEKEGSTVVSGAETAGQDAAAIAEKAAAKAAAEAASAGEGGAVADGIPFGDILSIAIGGTMAVIAAHEAKVAEAAQQAEKSDAITTNTSFQAGVGTDE